MRRDSAVLKTAGFSLIEVLVATAVIVVGVASLAQLFVVSARANRTANATSTTLLLAEQKMEELLGELDPRPSPPGALLVNTPGYIDYLDQSGVALGFSSIAPSPGTAYICRWSITPLPDGPATAIVVQVLVAPWPASAGLTRLVGVKTRKGS